jgi:hypothetical protein
MYVKSPVEEEQPLVVEPEPEPEPEPIVDVEIQLDLPDIHRAESEYNLGESARQPPVEYLTKVCFVI